MRAYKGVISIAPNSRTQRESYRERERARDGGEEKDEEEKEEEGKEEEEEKVLTEENLQSSGTKKISCGYRNFVRAGCRVGVG